MTVFTCSTVVSELLYDAMYRVKYCNDNTYTYELLVNVIAGLRFDFCTFLLFQHLDRQRKMLRTVLN